MNALDKIKLKLTRFYKSRIDRLVAKPLEVVAKNGQVIIFFQENNSSRQIISAVSYDGFDFTASEKIIDSFPDPKPAGFKNPVVVPDFSFRKRRVLYFGDRTVNLAYSVGGNSWKAKPKPLIIASRPIEVGQVFNRQQGLLLLFYEKTVNQGISHYAAGLALFDKKKPDRLIWKTEQPIWQQQELWPDLSAQPIGAVFHDKLLITYWWVNQKVIYGVIISGFKYDPTLIHREKLKLKKHRANPIISPKPDNSWEAFNTFNPAAIQAGGKVHILYRAQGFDYISSVGYAASSDGMTIDERLNQPVYQPVMDFETNSTGAVNPDLMSGGGYGGCEDPRLTLIDDRVYMTYVAFNGWSSLRLALTSILLDDFLNKRWNWTKPVLISPPGVIAKSGCLLPEKINGQYVFFHRVFPNIKIDFVDNLNFNGKIKWLKGEYEIKVRPDMWDSRKIGVGAPPLKTKDGWLLIYYGVDEKDASKYHVGAMLLDLKDPTKILYRTDQPILSPSENYETAGFKPGITYPCGAVIVKDQLLVYYGAADSVVCVAAAYLDTFLAELKARHPVHLADIRIREVEY